MRRQRTRKSRIHKGTYVSVMKGITDPLQKQGQIGKVTSIKTDRWGQRSAKIRFADKKIGEYEEDTIKPSRLFHFVNEKKVLKKSPKILANIILKGTKQEHKEHPEFSKDQALMIALDHLKENPKYYDTKPADEDDTWDETIPGRISPKDIFPMPLEKYTTKEERKQLKEDSDTYKKEIWNTNVDNIMNQIEAKDLRSAQQSLGMNPDYRSSPYEEYLAIKKKLLSLDEKGKKRFKDIMGYGED